MNDDDDILRVLYYDDVSYCFARVILISARTTVLLVVFFIFEHANTCLAAVWIAHLAGYFNFPASFAMCTSQEECFDISTPR